MSARSTFLGLGLLLWGCTDPAERSVPGSAEVSAGASASATSEAAPIPAPAPTATPAVPPTAVYEDEELPEIALVAESIEEQRAAMVRRMRALHGLDDAQVAAIEAILSKSKWLGQGNPAAVRHPLTRPECAARRQAAGVRDEKKAACGAPFMVPLYDPAHETEDKSTVCIDRYEFPGLPCEYPVTWVRTREAQALCKTMGKRLCDAHEWEGACAGALLPAEKEYAFRRPRKTMQGLHNVNRDIRWAYGPDKDHSKCATTSSKSPKCTSPSWKACGSNTFPAGSFPDCKSPLGVYDLHGNVAEHMWLPMVPEELGSRGGKGVPEMKGSWFIWSKHEAHIDDCRWRAPSWHDNEGDNHYSYHLGFRCCKDVAPSR